MTTIERFEIMQEHAEVTMIRSQRLLRERAYNKRIARQLR